MTKSEKDMVSRLQREGVGYKRIAAETGLSVNTVKSYCVRHSNDQPEGTCPNCGAAVAQAAGRKAKRFCSDACRMAWWRKHPEQLRRRAFYHLVCAYCGKPFDSYGNAKRKYCCRACYDKARSGREAS